MISYKSTFAFAAPDEAPTITKSVSPTSTSLCLSWSPPSPEKQNGILTNYTVTYTNDPNLPIDMWQTRITPDASITLTGLNIYTEYTVSVAAATVAGVGPRARVVVRTLNDSKCIS